MHDFPLQLNRAFSLMGIDVGAWYASVPRILRAAGNAPVLLRGTVDHYYRPLNCRVCLEPSAATICQDCSVDSAGVATVLGARRNNLVREEFILRRICQACQGDARDPIIVCVSADCPVYFARDHFERAVCGYSTEGLLDNLS